MKLFTVAEANALLPTVQQILKRIQLARKKLASYQDEAKAAAENADRGGGGMSDGLRYANFLIDFTSQTSELDVLGVQLKDFDRGLVDFPSLRDGRVVPLSTGELLESVKQVKPSTRAWFESDAADACIWLRRHGVLDDDGKPTFHARS